MLRGQEEMGVCACVGTWWPCLRDRQVCVVGCTVKLTNNAMYAARSSGLTADSLHPVSKKLRDITATPVIEFRHSTQHLRRTSMLQLKPLLQSPQGPKP